MSYNIFINYPVTNVVNALRKSADPAELGDNTQTLKSGIKFPLCNMQDHNHEDKLNRFVLQTGSSLIHRPVWKRPSVYKVITAWLSAANLTPKWKFSFRM